METIVNVQLTPLTENELTTIEGGGLLTSLVTSAGATAAGLVLSAAGTLGSVRGTANNLLTFLI